MSHFTDFRLNRSHFNLHMAKSLRYVFMDLKRYKMYGKERFKQVLGWPNGILALAGIKFCFEQRKVG